MRKGEEEEGFVYIDWVGGLTLHSLLPDTLGPVATLSVTPALTGGTPVLLSIAFSKPCASGTQPVCTNTTCNVSPGGRRGGGVP